MAKEEEPWVPKTFEQAMDGLGGFMEKASSEAMGFRVLTAGATIGALISPEIPYIPENVSTAILGGLAVGWGLKSLHVAIRDGVVRHVHASQAMDELRRVLPKQ